MPGLEQAIELHRAGRRGDAEAACRSALVADPSDPRALSMLGMLLGQAGRHGEAAAVLDRSLALRPNQPQALYNLGVARERTGDLTGAARAYRRAVGLAPAFAEAHRGLGSVLYKAGRNAQAAECCRAAVRLRPDFADAWAAMAKACGELGWQAEATASRRRVVELRPDAAAEHSDLLYDLHYDPAVSPEQMFAEHLCWARRHADPLSANVQPHCNDRDPHRRLRVGYVSADFRAHPVARFQEPVLAHHDHGAFEVFCYSDVAKPDPITERLQSYADVWRETRGLDDARLAEMIREDRIDVLVDLDGHAAGNRLLAFARRPAPVQVTCNGYVDTTGMAAMDCRFTDALHDPPGDSDRFHTERLVRLPACNWCYRPDDDSPPVSPLPCLSGGAGPTAPARDRAGDAPPEPRGCGTGFQPVNLASATGWKPVPQPRLGGGLALPSRGNVTFGCLNKLYKVTSPMLDLWARVLKQVPGSRLLLVVQGGDEANPSVRESIVRRGIDSGRVEVLGKAASRREYLERFGRIDVALDTFPFNGITTTCDALWMGVPVVSRVGRTHVSRAGLSLLTNVGLGELACATPGRYVECATQLATDRGRLSAIRRDLRRRMEHSPLRDERRYACAAETAYRMMWGIWCNAQPASASGESGPLAMAML